MVVHPKVTHDGSKSSSRGNPRLFEASRESLEANLLAERFSEVFLEALKNEALGGDLVLRVGS